LLRGAGENPQQASKGFSDPSRVFALGNHRTANGPKAAAWQAMTDLYQNRILHPARKPISSLVPLALNSEQMERQLH